MMTTEDMQEFDANQRAAQGEPDDVVLDMIEPGSPLDADPAYAGMSTRERDEWLDEHDREAAEWGVGH